MTSYSVELCPRSFSLPFPEAFRSFHGKRGCSKYDDAWKAELKGNPSMTLCEKWNWKAWNGAPSLQIPFLSGGLKSFSVGKIVF